jgi:quinoprotein glucose dehydrogenase
MLITAVSCTQKTSPSLSLDSEQYSEWSTFLGDKASTQYSSLQQINRSNVNQLEVAWTFSTGDLIDGVRTEIQANPIIIGDTLYSTSPLKKLFALKADSGELLWMFDPFEGQQPAARGVNRGVAYWSDNDNDEKRILYVAGARLFSIDAKTGEPDPIFGENGSLDFGTGLSRDAQQGVRATATSPGVIFEDKLIIGSRVYNRAPGHIRAFNVRTGEIEWIFHTIPLPGQFGYDTWPDGAWTQMGNANSWAGMSLDEERKMVFAPVASPGHDFYGGDRHGKNLFGSSLLALDAETGERVWHYQFIRHDIWDYDPPATPNLITVQHEGQFVDAVAQVTKFGYVYVFDRETGEPLFPIEEFAVPQSDLKGEETWPVQRLPVKPEPYARTSFTEADITTISEASHYTVLRRFLELRTGNMFDPPSTQGTLIFPGFDGGAEWGGSAFDPETGILYVNSNEMPWILEMVELESDDSTGPLSVGLSVYSMNCSACHGADRAGQGHSNMPSLIDIDKRLTDNEIETTIKEGKGVMPPFTHLSDEEVDRVIAYLKDPETVSDDEIESVIELENQIPYTFTGYNRFFDPEGYPAIKPPWGTLNAIDLNTGEYVWKTTLGEFEELTERGIPPTGTENYGGPVVTAGDILFIAATQDEKFRAFDKKTGEILWETDLPAGGYATPATYIVHGKQYVVIAAGGGKMGTKSGDTYVAFALPE